MEGDRHAMRKMSTTNEDCSLGIHRRQKDACACSVRDMQGNKEIQER